MSEENILNEEQAVEVVVEKTIGTQLRAQREAQGITPESVASRLKVSIRQIQALEEDNMAALPGNIFIRGLVRSYGRMLGMDVDALVVSLGQTLPKDSPHGEFPVEHAEGTFHAHVTKAGGSRGWLWGIVIILLLVAAGFAARQWLPQNWWDFSRTSTVASAVAASDVGEDVPIEEASQVASAPAAVLPSAASAVAQASEPVAKPVPGVVLASAAAAAVPAANTVQIQAIADAWVMVKDSTGETLFMGTVKEGDTKNVGGQPPYQVRIGNVANTRISYNGRPVEVTSSSNVATIEVK